MDVCGLIALTSFDKHHCFFTFIDDYVIKKLVYFFFKEKPLACWIRLKLLWRMKMTSVSKLYVMWVTMFFPTKWYDWKKKIRQFSIWWEADQIYA